LASGPAYKATESFIFNILDLLVAMQQPVTTSDIAAFLDVDSTEELQSALNLLSLVFSTGSDGKIQAVHKSVVDWLSPPNESYAKLIGLHPYLRENTKAHQTMVESCSKIL